MTEINSQAVTSLILTLLNTNFLSLSYSIILFSTLLLSGKDNCERSFKLKSSDTNFKCIVIFIMINIF